MPEEEELGGWMDGWVDGLMGRADVEMEENGLVIELRHFGS